MSLSSRPYVNRYTPSNRFPLGVKWLLIATIGLSILFLVAASLRSYLLVLALVPAEVVQKLWVWQLVTYVFLHGGVMQLVWNMLALWLFGAELERTWGTTRFVRFYLLCGAVTALVVVVVAYISSLTMLVISGSSGAIFGLLVAYALVFPDRTILFGFLVPMKSKYFVMIFGGIVLLQTYMATGSGPGFLVEIVAQLGGGLVAGFLLLRGKKLQFQLREPVVAGYKDWKMRRAKKKFEVYLKKRDSDRDRWVH